ncbi:MAG: hypothetical protein WEF99_18485 [Thermoanaerobaculia bacterium]
MSLRGRLIAVLAAAAPLSCASAPPSSPVPACSGFTPPMRISTGPSKLPDSFLAARVGGEVVDEVVIREDGAVGTIRPTHSKIAELAPFAEASLRRSRFSPASIEGNRVSARILVSTPVGIVREERPEPAYDSLWAHIPGGESREARWQLAGSVERLAVEARLAAARREERRGGGGAPDGAERILWKGAPSGSPADVRETVKTGGFFARPGDYRLELRAGGRVLATTTLTIAPDFQTAIINACEPLKSSS